MAYNTPVQTQIAEENCHGFAQNGARCRKWKGLTQRRQAAKEFQITAS